MTGITEYKITFRNQLKSLEFLIYGSFMFMLLIFILFINEEDISELLLFFSVYYLVLFLPTLFLHLEYFFKNKGDVFKVDGIKKFISFNKEKAISFNDIESIIYVMPPVWHRKSIIRFFPFEDYHYAEINLKSGEQFILTCLMAYPVEAALEPITEVKIQKRKRLLASTWLG